MLHRLAGPLVLAAAPGAPGDAAALIVDDGPAGERPPPTVVRVEGAAWQVVQPGAASEEALRRQAACLIVFVCTGNTCRSPLAEALCKARLAERLGCTAADLPERGFHVLSAGLSAASGGPAADEAVEAARSYGADLTPHRSRPLSPELAAQADYLVAMTRGHLVALAWLPRPGGPAAAAKSCGRRPAPTRSAAPRPFMRNAPAASGIASRPWSRNCIRPLPTPLRVAKINRGMLSGPSTS